MERDERTGPRLREVWPWPGLPEEAGDVPVPPGMRFEEDGTWVRKGDPSSGAAVWRQVAAGPVALVGMEMDVDGGGLWLRLAWLDQQGRTQCHAAPRSILGRRQPDPDVMAAGLPALVTRWPDLAEMLAQWEALARAWNALPRRWRVGRLGWAVASNGAVFALPDGVLGAAPAGRTAFGLAHHRALLLGDLFAQGQWEGERDAVVRLLVEQPPAAWVMGHAAAAVGMRWWRRAGLTDLFGYVVELTEDQGAALAAALAPWGGPGTRWPFRGTDQGLAEMLRARPDLPIAYMAPVSSGRRHLSILAHAALEGAYRVRAKPASDVLAAPLWHGVVLWMGRAGRQGDTLQRENTHWWLPACPMSAFGGRGLRSQLDGRLRAHHGHGGRQVIRWVLEQGGGDIDGITEVMRRLWEEAARDVRGFMGRREGAPSPIPDHDRDLQGMAAAGLAGLRLLAHGYGWNAAVLRDAEGGYREVLCAVAQGLEPHPSTTWRTALAALGMAVAAESHRITGHDGAVLVVHPDDLIGAWVRVRGETEPCLALSPRWVRDVLGEELRGVADVDAIAKAWAEEGVLVLPRRGKGGHGLQRLLYQHRIWSANGLTFRRWGWMFRPRTPDGWRWLPDSVAMATARLATDGA